MYILNVYGMNVKYILYIILYIYLYICVYQQIESFKYLYQNRKWIRKETASWRVILVGS